MQTTRDITVILDNGGGATLQVSEVGRRYQHRYEDGRECGRAYAVVANGGDIDDWPGNEYTPDASLHGETGPDGQTYSPWLEPDDEACRNGGYRVCRYLALVVDAAASGWRNAQLVLEGIIACGGAQYINERGQWSRTTQDYIDGDQWDGEYRDLGYAVDGIGAQIGGYIVYEDDANGGLAMRDADDD